MKIVEVHNNPKFLFQCRWCETKWVARAGEKTPKGKFAVTLAFSNEFEPDGLSEKTYERKLLLGGPCPICGTYNESSYQVSGSYRYG